MFSFRSTRIGSAILGAISPGTILLTSVLIIAACVLSPLAWGASDVPPKAWSGIRVDPHPEFVVPDQTPVVYRSEPLSAGATALANNPDVAVTTATNTTQSENSVFVSPLNSQILLNSNNSSNWPVSAIFGASYWVSTNGGATWTGSTAGAGGANNGDPATGIDRNGRMYIGYISSTGGMGCSYSTNSGVSWTARTVSSTLDLDKNHLWVDNSLSSAHEGNIYNVWTNFRTGNPNVNDIEFSRSTDGGVTWSSPLNVSNAVNAGSHNQGVNVQTAANGDVYVTWAIYDSWPSNEVALGFAKSTNGGASFAPATRIQTINGTRNTALGGSKTMRHASYPSMSVNQQTGAIHIVWTNIGVPGTGTGDFEVYTIASTNGGTSWSAPIRVNQDTQGNGKDQWMPWVACDPVTGDLSCIFYDSRNFVSNNAAETFVAVSQDGGSTWSDLKVSDFSWSGDGIVGFAGNYAGDYIAIAARDGNVYPMWSDNHSGNMLVYVSPFTTGAPCDVTADFSGTPTSGCASLAVNFTDLSTGPVTSWLWNFGDGSPTSSAQDPSHSYTTAGTYNVTLTATSATCSDAVTKTGYVTVNSAPTADFSGGPLTGAAPLSVTFTDLSTGGATSWSWNFGDGSPVSTAQTPVHSYANAGDYTVTLTASNACGADVNAKTNYIHVDPPGAGTKAFALSDIPVAGTVAGNYTNTLTSDNSYEVITEVLSGGKPSNRYSYLEHKWQFNVTAGNTVVFKVEAYRPNNAEGDNFTFGYSTDNVNFTAILSVSSATEQVYSEALPSGLSGTVYIRVIDTDHTKAKQSLDAVYIDQMYIESSGTPPPAEFMHVGSIVVSRQTSGGNRASGVATVTIVNLSSTPVPGATVTGVFTGPNGGSQSGTTNGSGVIEFTTSKVKNPSGEWCFEVTNVSRPGDIYDSPSNVVTKSCESGPVFGPALAKGGLLPERTGLEPNYPNPFNAQTRIEYRLATPGQVRLELFNVLGARITTLASDYAEAGAYSIIWNGRDQSGREVASGVYFLRLSVDGETSVRPLTLLK